MADSVSTQPRQQASPERLKAVARLLGYLGRLRRFHHLPSIAVAMAAELNENQSIHADLPEGHHRQANLQRRASLHERQQSGAPGTSAPGQKRSFTVDSSVAI